MGYITANTTATLDGTTAFELGDETYTWGDFWEVKASVESPTPLTVKLILEGTDWSLGPLQFFDKSQAIIADNTTVLDGVWIDSISLYNEGGNNIALDNASVGIIRGSGGVDKISTGSWVDAIVSNSGDDKLTLKGEDAGTELAYMGRGNDTVSIGSGYIFGTDMGRGNDVVTVGSGAFHAIALGRDLDTVKFAATTTGDGIVDGGVGITDGWPDSDDFDTLDFSAFTKAVAVDFAARTARASNTDFLIKNFEAAIGGSKNDKLFGRDEDETFNGGAGNDTLNGRGGVDKLTGGVGSDTFEFETGDTSKARSKADMITDFTSADAIDLTGWDANSSKTGVQDFKYIGSAAFSGVAGQLHYVKAASDTWIEGDTNGDKKADFVIRLDDAVTMKLDYFDL